MVVIWPSLTAPEHTPKHNFQGTVRAARPEQTWQRLAPLLSGFGITRIADLTGLDCLGIPVAQAVRPNGCALTGSQGKGVSPLLARISAAMESIELYHAENLPAATVVESYANLSRQQPVVDPRLLEPGSHWARYHPDLPLGWLSGWDLLTQEPVLVPRGYLNLNTAVPDAEHQLWSVSSNGLASGNHLLEAISHGLLEVIERDCQWRWARARLQHRLQSLVDPDSICAPLLRGFLDQIAATGVKVAIADITSSLGIPTYYCSLSEPDNWQRAGTALGWGCHPSKEIALSRAITEAAQSRLTVIAGSRDDILPESYAAGQSHLYAGAEPTTAQGPSPDSTPQSAITLRDFEQQPEMPPTETFEAELTNILERLRGQGYTRAVVVNHTRPETGIPVVHVVVPGMRLQGH